MSEKKSHFLDVGEDDSPSIATLPKQLKKSSSVKTDSEDETESLVIRPKVFGTDKAKKRLLAFSISKQTPTQLKRIKTKVPKAYKNKPKISTHPCRATVESIEEEKQKELLCSKYNPSKYNAYSKPSDEARENLEDNKKSNADIPRDRIRSPVRRHRWSRSKSKSPESNADGRPQKSKSLDKGKVDEKNQNELSKNLPKSWEDLKQAGLIVGENFRQFKAGSEKSNVSQYSKSSRPEDIVANRLKDIKPHFDILKDNDKCRENLLALPKSGNFNDPLAIFPLKLVHFTCTKPTITWSPNPSFENESYCMDRSFLKTNATKPVLDIFNKIAESRDIQCRATNSPLTLRSWYPEKDYIKEIAKVDHRDKKDGKVQTSKERKVSLVAYDSDEDKVSLSNASSGGPLKIKSRWDSDNDDSPASPPQEEQKINLESKKPSKRVPSLEISDAPSSLPRDLNEQKDKTIKKDAVVPQSKKQSKKITEKEVPVKSPTENKQKDKDHKKGTSSKEVEYRVHDFSSPSKSSHEESNIGRCPSPSTSPPPKTEQLASEYLQFLKLVGNDSPAGASNTNPTKTPVSIPTENDWDRESSPENKEKVSFTIEKTVANIIDTKTKKKKKDKKKAETIKKIIKKKRSKSSDSDSKSSESFSDSDSDSPKKKSKKVKKKKKGKNVTKNVGSDSEDEVKKKEKKLKGKKKEKAKDDDEKVLSDLKKQQLEIAEKLSELDKLSDKKSKKVILKELKTLEVKFTKAKKIEGVSVGKKKKSGKKTSKRKKVAVSTSTSSDSEVETKGKKKKKKASKKRTSSQSSGEPASVEKKKKKKKISKKDKKVKKSKLKLEKVISEEDLRPNWRKRPGDEIFVPIPVRRAKMQEDEDSGWEDEGRPKAPAPIVSEQVLPDSLLMKEASKADSDWETETEINKTRNVSQSSDWETFQSPKREEKNIEPVKDEEIRAFKSVGRLEVNDEIRAFESVGKLEVKDNEVRAFESMGRLEAKEDEAEIKVLEQPPIPPREELYSPGATDSESDRESSSEMMVSPASSPIQIVYQSTSDSQASKVVSCGIPQMGNSSLDIYDPLAEDSNGSEPCVSHTPLGLDEIPLPATLSLQDIILPNESAESTDVLQVPLPQDPPSNVNRPSAIVNPVKVNRWDKPSPEGDESRTQKKCVPLGVVAPQPSSTLIVPTALPPPPLPVTNRPPVSIPVPNLPTLKVPINSAASSTHVITMKSPLKLKSKVASVFQEDSDDDTVSSGQKEKVKIDRLSPTDGGTQQSQGYQKAEEIAEALKKDKDNIGKKINNDDTAKQAEEINEKVAKEIMKVNATVATKEKEEADRKSDRSGNKRDDRDRRDDSYRRNDRRGSRRYGRSPPRWERRDAKRYSRSPDRRRRTSPPPRHRPPSPRRRRRDSPKSKRSYSRSPSPRNARLRSRRSRSRSPLRKASPKYRKESPRSSPRLVGSPRRSPRPRTPSPSKETMEKPSPIPVIGQYAIQPPLPPSPYTREEKPANAAQHRLTLDQRIELELGVKLTESPPVLNNPSQNFYFPPQPAHPPSQYQHVPPIPPPYIPPPPIPHYTSSQGSIVQVGNMMEVIPSAHPRNVPPPPPPPPQQKIVQVGNVLQVVPGRATAVVAPTPVAPEPTPPPPAAPPPEVEALQNPLVKAFQAEREKRKKEKEMRRQERENRRLARQAKRDAKVMAVTERLKKSERNEGLVLGQDLEDEELLLEAMEPPSPPGPMEVVIESGDLPPAGRSILVPPGVKRKKNQSVKKGVKFADGLVPGDVSDTGGEEMEPTPPKAKLPKEKRFKKKMKKKVKVRIVRQETASDDDDNLPPPSPPPGDPPPVLYVAFPFGGQVQYPVYQTSIASSAKPVQLPTIAPEV